MIVDILRSATAALVCVFAGSASFAQSPAAAADGPTATRAAQTAGAQQVAAPAASSSAAPSLARENYRIGPYDVLELRVLGEPEMSASSLKVSAAGFIQVPFVDEDIRAQCLTERELSAVISDRLKKHLKYPEVHVGVKEYNSIPVSIIGAVNQPGRFRMERRVSLLELITFAGGVKTESGKAVTLVRQSAEVQCDQGRVVVADVEQDMVEVISLKSLLQGESAQNPMMRPGDIVIVPVADVFYVAGDVPRPNSFVLREGMTFTQALAQAGGPSPTAKRGSIRIVRQSPGKDRETIAIDLKAIDDKKVPDPLILPNDVIEVPNSGGKTFFRNFIGALGGSVGNLPVTAIP
ncbi:MAG: SLBB domain-containing protein [Blastocatellia bacterium]|nr:SLBB domain-containing protein [Blastocatellia bacterium]